VTRTVWGADPAGMQVALYRIDGGGHAEPSRLKRYPTFINCLTGRQNGDVEIADAAWTLFKEKRFARTSAGV
jgi:polyhydroxybutyrate depolymerase